MPSSPRPVDLEPGHGIFGHKKKAMSTATAGAPAPVHLEVPIFGPGSASAAVAAGAARLELNAAGSYPAGGLTPTPADLALTVDAAISTAAASSSPVPVRVMIRPRGPPRGGAVDFVYDHAEVAAMEVSVRMFRESGLLRAERGDGFVFGLLRWRGGGGGSSSSSGEETAEQPAFLEVDMPACQRLVRAAGPLRCVFHRAFDEVIGHAAQRRATGTAGDGPEWEAALEDLVDAGFDGILTSGGPGNAPDNATMLRRVRDQARDRIEIIVGGGVRSSNVRDLAGGLGMLQGDEQGWVHSSCLPKRTEAEIADAEEVTRILAELNREG